MSDRRRARAEAGAPAVDATATEGAAPSALEDIAEASRTALPASAARSAVEQGSAALAPGALGIARALEEQSEGVLVELAGKRVHAQIDRAVHGAVVATACKHQEMVLVTTDDAGKLRVVGALRTQPTPGVDAMDEIHLEAKRVRITGGEDVQIRSGVAIVALRAIGEVETYADRIVSRAEEVQKIVARMLRLN